MANSNINHNSPDVLFLPQKTTGVILTLQDGRTPEVKFHNGIIPYGFFRYEMLSGGRLLPALLCGGHQAQSPTTLRGEQLNALDIVKATIISGVTTIGKRAFEGCASLVSIIFPARIDIINIYAFADCSSLTVINLAGVNTINFGAFKGCTALVSVTLPSRLENIPNAIFENCISLTDINLHEGLKSIGFASFRGCISITNVILPKSLTNIGPYAFEGCSSLGSIDIPEGIKLIRENTFANCDSLTRVSLPNTLEVIYGSEMNEDVVESFAKGAFDGCKTLFSITLPENMTYIGDECFKNCVNLTLVVGPIMSILDYDFENCPHLKYPFITPRTPVSLKAVTKLEYWSIGIHSRCSIELCDFIFFMLLVFERLKKDEIFCLPIELQLLSLEQIPRF